MISRSRKFYQYMSFWKWPSIILQGRNQRQMSTELNAALRPFYFIVHPDLFGQHPQQRRVNEESLKLLSNHIENLYERKYHQLRESKTLKFYIRDEGASSRDTFKEIEIKIDQRNKDPKMFIQKLLETANLSTDYIKKIKSSIFENNNNMKRSSNGNEMTHSGFSNQWQYKPGQDYYYGEEFSNFEFDFRQAKEEKKVTLDSWIKENEAMARSRTKDLENMKEEVEKLQKIVVEELQLCEVRYDCGWNIEHFRGCLKSLQRLMAMYEETLHNLKGRVVVFGPFTGVSLEGHIMLFTGDVLSNWIDFIKNIPEHDSFLTMIPPYENALSQVLRNIKIGRRKFMPKQEAKHYANHLMKVTTSLGDYLSHNKYPASWPESLKEFEIVIESEAGPLMVSPTGQFIAPATCPGSILVDFITTNVEAAIKLTQQYKEQKQIEKDLAEECQNRLDLKSLSKDDSITPEKMIKTLSNLKNYELDTLHSLDLHITNYYSVLSDGTMCIPWDFWLR